jgi:hypothetical protein
MEARCSRDVVLLIRPQYKMSRRPSCFGGADGPAVGTWRSSPEGALEQRKCHRQAVACHDPYGLRTRLIRSKLR